MWEPVFQKVFRDQYNLYLEQSGRTSAVRRFADSIDLSPSATSEILAGHRAWRLTPGRALKLIEKFQLPESTRERLIRLIDEPEKNDWFDLPRAEDKILTDWTYSAVLFSYDLPGDKKTPEAISDRLGISVELVNQITLVLKDQGMLEVDVHGEIRRVQKTWTTSEDISDQVIKDHHFANLEIAEIALTKVPVAERDFSSLTFVGSAEQVVILKKEIRKLYEFTMALMESPGAGAEVFRMSVQLFPLNFNERKEK